MFPVTFVDVDQLEVGQWGGALGCSRGPSCSVPALSKAKGQGVWPRATPCSARHPPSLHLPPTLLTPQPSMAPPQSIELQLVGGGGLGAAAGGMMERLGALMAPGAGPDVASSSAAGGPATGWALGHVEVGGAGVVGIGCWCVVWF